MQDRTQDRENRQKSLRTLLRSRIGSFVYSGIHLSYLIRTNERRRLLPTSGRSRTTLKIRRSLRYTSGRLVFAGAHVFFRGGKCDNVPAVGTGSEIELSKVDFRYPILLFFLFYYYIVISIFSLDILVCLFFFIIVFHCYLCLVLHLIKDDYIEQPYIVQTTIYGSANEWNNLSDEQLVVTTTCHQSQVVRQVATSYKLQEHTTCPFLARRYIRDRFFVKDIDRFLFRFQLDQFIGHLLYLNLGYYRAPIEAIVSLAFN